MKKRDILREKPSKLFFSYLLPSISSTLVTSIYIFVDTVMIGKGVGEDGIAALNIILPVFGVLYGLGVLFGVGGGVLMSVANGAGNHEEAHGYFSSALVCAVVSSAMCAIVTVIFFEPLMMAMGADSTTYPLVYEYGIYIAYGSPLFLFTNFLQAFVRNDKAPRRAMVGVITGGITNVILDYVFIFPMDMGMAGASIATVIGNSVTIAILLTHFLSRVNTMRFMISKVSVSRAVSIIKSGVPSFLTEVASSVVILMFNLQLLKYVGKTGVTVYGIISNSTIIAMSLFNGVAQAAQPLIASSFGAGLDERVGKFRRYGIATAGLVGAVLTLTGVIFNEPVVWIFLEPAETVLDMARPAIAIYFISLVFMGVNVFSATYFQSVIKPAKSLAISLLRGVVLNTALVFVLPLLFDVTGIWLTVPVTEAIVFVISVVMYRQGKNTAKPDGQRLNA